MLKKIIMILAGIIAIVAVAGGLLLKSVFDGFDQVKLQYDNEVISELKNELDFSKYEKALEALGKDRLSEIEGLVKEKDIGVIQDSISKGDLSCEETLLYYVDRIRKYDSYYNSVISLNPNALEQARNLDSKIASGEDVGQLFGVMVLIKDNISDSDMNTTAGSYALRNLTTKRDSFVVGRLKSKDAIIIGKNNMSEWANYMSSPSSSGFSVLGGQTKNAYGKFDVGGSSSGSCVSASLDFATVTLGSETAGSVVFPSSQNSVVAIKPTVGLLSRDLVIPISEAQDTIGVIGKSVSDVNLVFNQAVYYDEKDEATEVSGGFEGRALREDMTFDKMKVAVYEGSMYKEETDAIVKELESLGAEVSLIKMEGDESGIDYLPVLNYGIVHDVFDYLNNPDVTSEHKSLKEIYEFSKEDPEKRMPFGASLHESAIEGTISEEEYEDLVKRNREAASKIIDDTLETNGVDFIVSASNGLSGIYAPANYPAVTVPAGYKKSGEPFGVTFVGRSLSDSYLLDIAYAFEKETGARMSPKEIGK